MQKQGFPIDHHTIFVKANKILKIRKYFDLSKIKALLNGCRKLNVVSKGNVKLHSFLEHAHIVENIEETIDHIGGEVNDCMAQSLARAQECTIAIFQATEPPSLLTFLDLSSHRDEDIRKKEIALARARVLSFIASFIEMYHRHGAFSSKYFLEIWNRCRFIARVDYSNRVKAEAYTVMINLLKYGKYVLSAADIGLLEYINKMFQDLKFGKSTQTAKGMELELLGHLVSQFPSEVEDALEDLTSWVEKSLEARFSSSSPETLLINGLLFAYAQLLQQQSARLNTEETKRQKIYSYLNTALATAMSGNMSRFQVTRASLYFLSQHGVMFVNEIGSHGYTWYSYMKFCCSSTNKTVKEYAFDCSGVVLSTINKYLVQNSGDDTSKKVLNKTLKEILPVFNENGIDDDTFSFTLQSLGHFAGAIYALLGAKSLVKIEDRVKQFGESLLVLNEKTTAVKWSLFTQYINCIGHFVSENKDTPLEDTYVSFLGDLLCHVMSAYGYCPWKTKSKIYKSIVFVFEAVQNRTVPHLLINRVIYHSILLSISNITDPSNMVPIYHPDTGTLETKLLYEYDSFWRKLLKSNSLKDEESAVQKVVFDAFMKNILVILKRLDLSYRYDIHTERSNKYESGYKPNVPRDHSIMLNLTELFQRVLTPINSERILPWVECFFLTVFQLSRQFPLVSAFYHIAKTLAILCEKGNVFKNLDKSSTTDVKRLLEEYQAFIHEVSSGLRFYKDELLVACSGFLLSTPVIVIKDIQIMLPALQAAISIGKSHTEIAEIAVSTLERWIKFIPDQLEASIELIIKSIASYLAQSNAPDIVGTSMPLSSLGGNQAPKQGTVSDQMKLQIRILKFLGEANGSTTALLSQQILSSGRMRGFETDLLFLELTLGPSGTYTKFPLDTIFHQIGQVALDSTDRRIKTSASEVYHALICYLCGKTATEPHQSGHKSLFYPLWEKSLENTLLLAVDHEKICRTIFQPLSLQITRWFCSEKIVLPHECSLLLEVLIENVTQATHSGLRDFAAKCLSEYLNVCVSKYHKNDTQAENQADELFERLFDLCHHPSAAQRVGVATTFLFFMREMDDNYGELIARKFGLLSLKKFLIALRLGSHNLTKNGTLDTSLSMMVRAIRTILKLAIRLPHIFGDSSSKDSANNLEMFLLWEFHEIASPSKNYRIIAREVFVTLSSLAFRSNSKAWLLQFISENDIHSILAPAETLAEVIHPSNSSHSSMKLWLEQYASTLECYRWCTEMIGQDAASNVLYGSRTSDLKRKNTPSDGDDGFHHLVISRAISSFLAFGFDDSKMDLLCHKKLFALYFDAMDATCAFLGFVWSSAAQKILPIDDSSFQRKLAFSTLECWVRSEYRSDIANVSNQHPNSVPSIRAFILRLRDIIPSILRSSARTIIDQRIHQMNERKLVSIYQLCITYSLFLELELLPESNAEASKFAGIAKKILDTCTNDWRSLSVASEAFKTACLLGWDISALFTDSKGQYYTCLSSEIDSFLPIPSIWKRVANNLVIHATKNPQTLRVLLSVLNQVASMQHIAVRKTSELSNFVESLLPSMKVLLRSLHKPHGDVLKDEAQFQRMIISVLVEIIKIVSKCSGTAIEDALSLSFFPDLGEVLLKMLQRRDLSYLVKADTLDLIGVIIHDQRAPETMLTGILSALEVFVVEEFPIVSTDVQKETKNYEIYSALFEQVLSLVERSGQVRFLRVLFSSLKEGKQHIFYAEINQTLSGFVCTLEYKKHLDSAKISKEMMELMEILLDKNVEDHIRTNLLDQVFRPLLERLSLSSSGASIVGKFFITETKSKGLLITRLANLMSSSTDMISIPGLVTGTVAFSSMEMLYRLVDADFIRTEVNSGFLGHTNGKGRELTMLVCKMASKFITTASNSCGKIDGDNSNEQFLEAYRIFYCNGYNCLLTAVSRTQKLEKFFDQILFPEVVWDKIIDTHRSNKFSAETPTFERIDVSLRLSVAASLQLSSTVGHSGQRASRQQKEKPSQSLTLSFLTGSSLSQATESLKSHDDVAESEIALLGVEFELDQWNQHESMLSLIRVLLLMFADFGSNWQPQLMPEWMKKIYGVISSSNKPLNIRVFLAKLVLNIPQVFEKYASSWIESIMDVMIQASIEVSTPEFHHILRDFCHLLIESWNAPSIVRAISTSKVSQFFNRLIPLCPSENNTVIQNNLLLMHQMLLLWSNENKVQVDWDELGHLLCEDLNASSRLDAGRKMTALQVMSVLLVEAEATSGGLSIFSTMEEIINGVLTAVSHKRNSIQVVAAEIVGLLLKYMNSESLYTHLRCHLTDQVQKLMTKAFEEEEYLRFLIISRNVSLHEPSILNEQMFHRLSFVLPKVIMIDKCAILAMEIFYAASKSKLLQLKQIFVHMEPLLQRFMEHCSSQVQHLTLETISLLLDGLDQNQYSCFLRKTSEKGRGYGLIEQYRNHPAPSTRSLLMDVLLKLLSLQLDTSDQHQVNIALLCGLTDPEPSLREKMFHIWTKRLSISAENRLKALFGELYAPSVSNKWVHYAAGLLLATAQHSEKFNDVIFTSNLQIGEDLQDMVVDSTWEGKSNVLTPLFSVEEDPLASSVMASQLETQTQTMLAATRSTQLDSTLSFASQNDNGYDTSTNVLSSSTLGASLSLGSQSALGPSESQYDSISQESAKRNLPRRRFINRSSSPFSNKSAGPNISKSSDKTFFQQQYALLRKAQQAMNQRQRRARKETVKMRRKYRIGTFPDIQVTMKDILSPLMALCELNVEISTSVFANVFAQIVSSITSNSIKDLAVKIDTVLSTDKTSDEVPERINGGFVACVQLALTNALKMKPELFENMAIPSSTIGESSLLTGNYHSGEVLLEEKLNWIASSSKLHEEEKARCWDQLYRLLSMLQNNNLLLALNNSTSNVEASYLATTAKLNGDISIAASSYLQAQEQLRTLEKDAKDETSLVKYQLESQRCYWERLNCMETLNQWEKTYQEISHFIVDENSFWKETSPYLEKALGLFLRSSVGITKDSSEKILDGFTFLKNCFEEKERWRLIKTTYPVETCLVFLNQESDESNRVRALVEDFYLDFLQKWQHTTSLSIPSRQKLLQNLSSMVEIDYFLQLNKTSEDFENFVAKWIHVTPDLGQGLLETWSQYYMVQSTLIPELIHFGLENSLISETSRIHILKQEADAMLLYANAAMANDVLSLASKYLKNFRERCREEEALPNVTVRMVDVFLSHVIKLADKKLKTNHSKDTIPMVTRYHATSTRMFDNAQVLELVQELSPQEKIKFGFLEAKAFAKAAEFHLAERVNESLGEESLQRALEAFDRSSRSLGTSQLSIFSERSRHRMEFIEFLMDLIMGEKKEVFAMYVNRKNLVQLVSESVLQGMSEGDKECAYYFPQLLDLVAEFKQDKCLVDKFQSQILTQVPAWTCLRWSAQLMALIDGPIGPTIIAILEKMAKEYPSALFYDFKITCSKKIHTDYKSKGIDVTRLERLLENSTMERFVDSLRMIHHPEIRFKEGLREVAKLFEEGYTQEAKIKFESVWKDCFALERPILGDKIGRYNREWARKTRKDIEKIMGKNGTNVTLKTVHTVRDYITNHFSVTPGKFGIGKDMKARLGDFAEWLEEFNPSKSTLELPGQYSTYWGKPVPERHVRILSFGLILRVMASKQLPKQITLHCSDEKDYAFLVKGGEDLRLDQRIEQLFDVMNQIIHAQPACQKRKLDITTYKVIPMTEEIGIIEWLNDTSTLKGVIENQLVRDPRCSDLQHNKRAKLNLFNTKPAKMYEDFLMKQRGSSYNSKVASPSSQDTTTNFRSAQEKIPGDLLRRQYLAMGADPQDFVYLRDSFSKSLAVFNTCSYILGIGDRHLDNFLVSHEDGSVIGIDFGVSFGAGASVLPVPELIPFRFTRQMETVFHPYDGINLQMQDMGLVLDALREKRQVIESVMNVFLHEPLLDWQKSITTHQIEIFDQQEIEVLEEETAVNSRSRKPKQKATVWLPDVKIAIARRKLEGFSPRTLLKEELAQNPHLGSQLGKFKEFVEGAKYEEKIVRVIKEEEEAVGPSSYQGKYYGPFEQAKELLVLATDPNVLGRTYHGWMPWL